MSIDWPRFAAIVQNAKRFLLTSHIRPDCDALGSELGLAGVLEALGKDVRIVNGQATPPNLAFIDPGRRIEAFGVDVHLEDLADREVLVVLDTSAWAQLGPMGDVLRGTKAKKIVLDHHQSEDDLGAELFKNVEAEATGRLVVAAAEHLGVALTPEIATPLFAAVATDTGWFRFPSATGGTYRIAAKLIDAGARPAEIYQELYERDTLGRVRLRGEALRRIQTELDGRLGHTYIVKSDFEQLGALASDTEDVINLVLTVEGTEAAVIFIELLGGGLKVSFRSRCALDCSQLAQQFGGGGHKAAAGASFSGTLEEVRPLVLDAVRAAMR
jgi:phosphoesterase RecJ-like protein